MSAPKIAPLSGFELIELAHVLATEHHHGQVDLAGQPYIEHVRRVAHAVGTEDPILHAAAVLHDVLEDTAATAASLLAQGIPEEVIEIVEALTRRGGETRREYWARVRAHERALRVKLADVGDNTDPARQAMLKPAVRERLTRKYEEALEALTGEREEQ